MRSIYPGDVDALSADASNEGRGLIRRCLSLNAAIPQDTKKPPAFMAGGCFTDAILC